MESEIEATESFETMFLKAMEPGAISRVGELLRSGELVVFPTDTLYGIGALAFIEVAIARLYQVKQRPRDKGIPILLADMTDLQRVTDHIPPMAEDFIKRFWPGPLTLILPKHPKLPELISPNDGVAVRIPDSRVARAVIREAGGAVATSSANLSGRMPATTGLQALEQLGGKVAAILDDGLCPRKCASTIIDCRHEKPVLVREGPIGAAKLALVAASSHE